MNLHPDLQKLLATFDARCRKLVLIRGLFTACAALGLFTILCATLDGTLLFEDPARLAAAAVIYGAAVGAAWFRAGTFLTTPLTPRELATNLEQAEPSIKGALLSAVELSGPAGISGDSIVLRELHQKRTAMTLAAVDCTRLLPWLKIRSDAFAAAGTLLTLVICMGYGGPRFIRQCLRVLFPLAPLERFSESIITVMAPSPNDGPVPAGEPISVTVEIQGKPVETSTLHVPSASPAGGFISMNSVGANRFQADMNVEQSPVDYRIKAGDGVTKLFHLTPRARPKILTFTRVYHPPAYTHLPETTETSATGKISALEGTLVDLTFKADQPIEAGTLKFSSGLTVNEIVLTTDPADKTLLHTKLLLNQNGLYSLRLISSTTHFSSAKGFENEVHVDIDLPPSITMETPAQDLVLALGEKVEFTGAAEDDYGLASLTQETSLNQGAWRPLPATIPTQKHHDIRCLWDPLLHNPKVGDTISVRFVAVDSKGQRTESRAIQISFAPRGMMPSASPALASQRALTRRVEEVSRQANEAAKSLQEAKAENEARTPNALKQTQSIARAKQALDSAVENAAAAREELLSQMKNESNLGALVDLKLQAQALNRIELGELGPVLQALDRLAPPDSETKAPVAQIETLKRAAEASAKGAAMANNTRDVAQTRLAAMEAQALATESRQIATEQATLGQTQKQPEGNADSPSNEGLLEALRRQQVNQSAAATLQTQLQTLSERSPTAASKLKNVRTTLQKDLQTADRLLRSAQGEITARNEAASATPAIQAGEALAKDLGQTAETLEALAPALQEAASKARQRLQNEQSRNSERLAQTSREMETLEKRKEIAPEDKTLLTNERLEAEAAVLRADARVEASRRNASPQMDHDLRAAASALDSAAGADSPADAHSKTAAAARALQTLEAVAALNEARRNTDLLSHNATREPEAPHAPDVIQQKALAEQLQKLAPEMRRAGLPEAAAAAATSAHNALLAKNEQNFEEAAKSLKQAAEAVLEIEQKARDTLNALSPSIATRMDALAAKSDQAANETRQLKAVEPQTTPPVPAANLKNEQKLARQLEQLRQELQAEASRQDSARAEGRASARDADAAAAQLKDSGKALASLKEANASRSEASKALEKAADQQSQTAKQLQQLAKHFRNLESGTPEQIAASRENLRNSEQQSGTRDAAEARESRAAKMAELAASPTEQAQAKLEEMLAEKKQTSPSSQSLPTADSQKALNNALEALKSGRTDAATKAISAAVDAQKESDRLARSTEGSSPSNSNEGTQEAPPSNSNGLPLAAKGGDANWGNLPKRLATDLMAGKKERTPSEYRASIDAYFQAVAERARGVKSSP